MLLNAFPQGKIASPAEAAGNTVSMIFWYVSLVLYQRCQGKRGHFENHPLFETSIPGTIFRGQSLKLDECRTRYSLVKNFGAMI